MDAQDQFFIPDAVRNVLIQYGITENDAPAIIQFISTGTGRNESQQPQYSILKETSEYICADSEKAIETATSRSSPLKEVQLEMIDSWTRVHKLDSSIDHNASKEFQSGSVALVSANKANYGSLSSRNSQIDIDFQLMRLGDSDGMTKWSKVINSIHGYIEQKITSDFFYELRECLRDTNLNEDARFCALIQLLNCVLHPHKVTGNYKPTVVTALEESILFAASDKDANIKLYAVYKRYQDFGLPVSPKLIFFGKNCKNLTEIR
ncbi:uncharacterized protein LOC131432266 [Malaya genurostris]|uniref:uncharacterized protein LOC131432266 n=1 Tax=Malaya genurostris TaxID=325434 RepID=UPI0026F3F028|nr:uncharacterized protein LOC131431581 isoform X4 [Malaya genurostris]XP_058454411.1 uncharacterized protein LOC131432266 [Malaya genurostris]